MLSTAWKNHAKMDTTWDRGVQRKLTSKAFR